MSWQSDCTLPMRYKNLPKTIFPGIGVKFTRKCIDTLLNLWVCVEEEAASHSNISSSSGGDKAVFSSKFVHDNVRYTIAWYDEKPSKKNIFYGSSFLFPKEKMFEIYAKMTAALQ